MTDETPRQRWGVLIPAATFLVGLLIGGLVIGVGRSGSGAGSAAGDGGSSSSASPTASGSDAPADTVVTVPAACQEAAANVREATRLLRRTVGDVRNFKPDEIVTTLNRLETLDNETRPLLQECSQVAVTTGATPVPSSSSSGS